jgi:hypothetical protein
VQTARSRDQTPDYIRTQLTYNLTARAAARSPRELLCTMDDFTLDPPNSRAVVAAAWTDDSVLSFPTCFPHAGFGQRALLLEGVQRPTD